MKKYNVCLPKKYQKDGEDKTYWAKVGIMTDFEEKGGKILDLHHLQGTFQLFRIESEDEYEAKKAAKTESPAPSPAPVATETKEEIPF